MAEDKVNPTEKEVKDEVDELEAIHIIESGDAKRFGEIAKDIMQDREVFVAAITVDVEMEIVVKTPVIIE